VLGFVRFLTSLLIAAWGLAMILLGLANRVVLWVPLGLAVLIVGLPLLASNPLAARRLYPTRVDTK
jgi:hypothetical protein